MKKLQHQVHPPLLTIFVSQQPQNKTYTLFTMATRGRRRAADDDDEEAAQPRAAAPAPAPGGAAAARAGGARTAAPKPAPTAADADPDSITPEFLAVFNAQKAEIERLVECVK